MVPRLRSEAAGNQHPATGYSEVFVVWKLIKEQMVATSLISTRFRPTRKMLPTLTLMLNGRAVYEGISRCNTVIQLTNKALAAGKITQDEATNLTLQARALRGWYHFEAWRMWEKIPYLDENY